MSYTNPLAQVAAAETQVVNAIDAATEQMNRLGTSAIDEAVARYREACFQAKARIEAAYRQVLGSATDFAFEMGSVAGVIGAAIETPVQLPEKPKEVEPKPTAFEQAFGLTYEEAVADQRADAKELASPKPEFVAGHHERAAKPIPVPVPRPTRKARLNGKVK